MATKNIVPRANGEGNIGTSIKNWLKGWFGSVFVSGNVTDGSNNVTVANLKTAYDHSQAAHAPSNANYYVHPNHSGDVTSVADGAQTIATAAVTLAKMANLAQSTIIGRVTASTGVPEALSATNVRTIINVADGATANTKASGSELDTGTDDTKFLTAKAFTDSKYSGAVNAQTGTTYTFVLADASKFVTCNNASAVTVTVPPNSSVAFPVGTQIDVAQLGAGKVTLAQGSGVTISSKGGNKAIGAQYEGVTLKKIATDTWLLMGDLIA
jgi:hypothetical protein